MVEKKKVIGKRMPESGYCILDAGNRLLVAVF
jgi:hypothetical protein